MAIEIVDLPIENMVGDFLVRYVSLPEGNTQMHDSQDRPLFGGFRPSVGDPTGHHFSESVR